MHQNIQFVGIVLGAALGGYLVWLVPSRSRILAAGTLLIALAAAFLGAVLGRIVGPGVEQGFWWSKSSTDSTVHLVAAALGTLVATVVALVIRRSSQSGPEVPDRPLRWEERET